jgi:hypothetical protein
MGIPIRIGIEHAQTTLTLALYKISWSPCSLSVFSLASFVNAQIEFLGDICVTEGIGYEGRVALTIASPFILTSLLWILLMAIRACRKPAEPSAPEANDPEVDEPGRRRKCFKDPTLFNDLFRSFALVVLLVHPTISEVVLQHWMVQDIDGISRLTVDPSVRADGPEMATTSPVVVFAMLFIVCGIPVAYTCLMLWARWKVKLTKRRVSRSASNVGDQQSAPIKSNRNLLTLPGGWIYGTLGFSFAHYNVNKKLSLYYEVVRIFRKFLLIAISVFIRDPTVQGYCGLALLIVNACVVAWTKPYRWQVKQYNLIELGSMAVCALTATLGKIDELDNQFLGANERLECRDPSAASVLIMLLNGLFVFVLLCCVALEAWRRAVSGYSIEAIIVRDNWERVVRGVLKPVWQKEIFSQWTREMQQSVKAGDAGYGSGSRGSDVHAGEQQQPPPDMRTQSALHANPMLTRGPVFSSARSSVTSADSSAIELTEWAPPPPPVQSLSPSAPPEDGKAPCGEGGGFEQHEQAAKSSIVVEPVDEEHGDRLRSGSEDLPGPPFRDTDNDALTSLTSSPLAVDIQPHASDSQVTLGRTRSAAAAVATLRSRHSLEPNEEDDEAIERKRTSLRL